MKQYWSRLETRIDALSLRERAMAFGIAALLLVTFINVVVLDPLLAQQKQLSQQVTQNQQQIAALQAQIQQRVKSHDADPDAAGKRRVEQLRQQSARLRTELAGVQQGVVAPERMADMLRDLLARDGRLQLVSLKTLAPALLSDAPAAEPKQAALPASPDAAPKPVPAEPAGQAVYRHGVEIVVSGSYADIATYLAELEQLPWQLFWSTAQLSAEKHPVSTLRLNLFTLSFDKKWLNI